MSLELNGMLELTEEEKASIDGGGFWEAVGTIGAGVGVMKIVGISATTAVSASPVGAAIAVTAGLVAAYNYFK